MEEETADQVQKLETLSNQNEALLSEFTHLQEDYHNNNIQLERYHTLVYELEQELHHMNVIAQNQQYELMLQKELICEYIQKTVNLTLFNKQTSLRMQKLLAENAKLHDEIENLQKLLQKIPLTVQKKLNDNGHKRKRKDNVGNKQKKRRTVEVQETVAWISTVLDSSVEDICANAMAKIENETITHTADEMLKLKDEILLADWAYQKLRNCLKIIPSLAAVKKARRNLNAQITLDLGVTFSDGIINLKPQLVLNLIKKRHANLEFVKVTFDHRRNEGRDEVLVGLIPITPKAQHSPNFVYPILLYCGKEESIHENCGFKEINEMIQNNQNITFIMSSDMKSFWLLSGKKFKQGNDHFCPYCNITKNKIEANLRGTSWSSLENGNIGPLHIPPSFFCFCWLHCKLRITETLLRHNIRSFYSFRKNGKQGRLRQWETTLQKLTSNTGIHIKAPTKKEDDRDFGKVVGLTGDMVHNIVDGAHEFTKLTPKQRSRSVQEVWSLWKQIIEFIENNSVPTEEFKLILKQFGKHLLDTYEWKILTAYSHILVAHSCDVMLSFGNISLFSQEGLEAANKVHKQIAKRASNHGKKKAIHQQVLHIYRRIYQGFI